ncbi:MAG: alpha/beta fold hydrolase [Planctomycetales bacterium]|nr:alpha/beta fold hydrolase [Planctomycetales bacterium]
MLAPPRNATADHPGFRRFHNWVDGGNGIDAAAFIEPIRTARVEHVGAELPFEQLAALQTQMTFQSILSRSTMSFGSRQIEYWSAGTSEPNQPVLLLISGAGNTIDTWAPIAETLAAQGQVIAVNRPGYGATDPLSDFTGEKLARDIRHVVSTLAPNQPVIVMGHSFVVRLLCPSFLITSRLHQLVRNRSRVRRSRGRGESDLGAKTVVADGFPALPSIQATRRFTVE